MSQHPNNKKVRQEKNKKVASGFRKHCGESGSVFLNNRKWSPTEVDAGLTRRAQAEDAVESARIALYAAILERERIEKETEELYEAVRRLAFAMFGTSVEILADFGLALPKQRRALTVAEKVDAAAKGLRTKAARHTMGRRQRLRIHAADPPPSDASPEPSSGAGPA